MFSNLNRLPTAEIYNTTDYTSNSGGTVNINSDFDETQYINIAKEMANSTSDLRSQRSNLRKRMKNSILMNHTAFAENFENTIRQIWQEWCQTQS